MADFWIKIEKGTPDKPEILELAGILNIDDPDTVTGKMIRVWSWFDSNSENGHAPLVTKVLLDRVTGVTGFTEALVTVGWLEKKDNGYSIPNFDRHLGKGAKKRASDAERKRKSRERSQLCHDKVVTEKGLDKSRVEKSREDNKKHKKESVSLDFSCLQMSDDEVEEIKDIRKKAKSPITQRVINTLAKEFDQARKKGWSNDDILSEWSSRGWRSFKAEWVGEKKKESGYKMPDFMIGVK